MGTAPHSSLLANSWDPDPFKTERQRGEGASLDDNKSEGKFIEWRGFQK